MSGLRDMAKTTLINVSNRLPVTVTPAGITRSSGGLVAALEGLDPQAYDLKWIGWPGGDLPDAAERQRLERTLREEQGCIPLFLPKDLADAHYEGFSNSSLWPLLHYMPTYFRYELEWWEAYYQVNERFADLVAEQAGAEDLVWVHDYQLMLLPRMLRRRRPELRIGFFLHTPFPSYEIFRCLPQREELLDGLLGADQVGFHTFGYLRHFRSSVLRLLGIESDIIRIRQPGPDTYLGVYPIGINAAKYDQRLDTPAHRTRVEELGRAYDNKRIVLSVERLDYTKGILHRLEAIDLFLDDYEERDRLRFIFVAVPSRGGVEQYQQLREEIEHKIGRINGKHASLRNDPIKFIFGTVPFEDLAALYSLAEVCLVTPVRDGMNLVAKEYIACQRDEAGVLVLSEFAGAAEELFNAIIVNPFDARETADAIRAALELPIEERRLRMRSMRGRVMSYDAQAWARQFIDELRARPTEQPPPPVDEARQRLRAAHAAKQRIGLFLDYDGTLREIVNDPAAARPTDELREVLALLARQPHVTVTLISGRTQEDLETFVGDTPFGLIAEHGAALRRPGSRQWEQLDENTDYGWKREIHKLLDLYAASTPGSFVEEKRTGLVWHYRKADPEFGRWKASELTEELTSLLANEPVQIRHGRKIVEVASAHVTKGRAVSYLLSEQTFDLVLTAGDDVTDESMFALEVPGLITIKIGEADTRARYRIATPADLRRLLMETFG